MKSLNHPADPSLRSDFKDYILSNTVLGECSFCHRAFVATAEGHEAKWCWTCNELYRRVHQHMRKKKVFGLSQSFLLSCYGAGTPADLEAMAFNTGI